MEIRQSSVCLDESLPSQISAASERSSVVADESRGGCEESSMPFAGMSLAWFVLGWLRL
jgi:hypothetical protein